MFCFQHCSGVTQFCTGQPDTCSQCGAALHASRTRTSDDVNVHYELAPFRVPCPFHAPCSPAPPPATLLVRRAGREKREEIEVENVNQEMLHIGIVDGQGHVHDFSEGGYQRELADGGRWWGSVCVPAVRGDRCDSVEGAVEKVLQEGSWNWQSYNTTRRNCLFFIAAVLTVPPLLLSPSLELLPLSLPPFLPFLPSCSYDSTRHNCLHFITAVLTTLLSPHLMEPRVVVETLIAPQLALANKYRRVLSHVQSSQVTTPTHAECADHVEAMEEVVLAQDNSSS